MDTPGGLLEVDVQQTGPCEAPELLVRLTGSIEESVNFEQLIGMPAGELHVNCKEVPRINSVGVKAWIKYFHSVGAKGTTLVFEECSTAIVEQITLISNFLSGGRADPISFPFFSKY